MIPEDCSTVAANSSRSIVSTFWKFLPVTSPLPRMNLKIQQQDTLSDQINPAGTNLERV